MSVEKTTCDCKITELTSVEFRSKCLSGQWDEAKLDGVDWQLVLKSGAPLDQWYLAAALHDRRVVALMQKYGLRASASVLQLISEDKDVHEEDTEEEKRPENSALAAISAKQEKQEQLCIYLSKSLGTIFFPILPMMFAMLSALLLVCYLRLEKVEAGLAILQNATLQEFSAEPQLQNAPQHYVIFQHFTHELVNMPLHWIHENLHPFGLRFGETICCQLHDELVYETVLGYDKASDKMWMTTANVPFGHRLGPWGDFAQDWADGTCVKK